MLAPALAEATAVAETEGEGSGVGVWPKAVETSAIEQRQVKMAVFIGVLCSEMQPAGRLDSKNRGPLLPGSIQTKALRLPWRQTLFLPANDAGVAQW